MGQKQLTKTRDASTYQSVETTPTTMTPNARSTTTGVVAVQQQGEIATQRGDSSLDHAERLRAIVETAVDGIITIDSTGTVETMNPATERMFGFSAAQVIGHNISMLMPEPYCSEHNSYLQRYLLTAERRIIGIGREVLGRRQDGSVFPMELAVSEMYLGGRRMFTGIVRDITERRTAEDKLRRLAALLDDSNDAIKSLDLSGNIIAWNTSAERLYGYAHAVATRMNIRELLPLDRCDEMANMTERLKHGERIPPFETQRVAADGQLVDIQCTLTLLKGRDGYPDEVVVTDRDITERKRNEAALRGSEAKTRAIVEAAVDGIITIDSGGLVESVNRAAELLFGYAASELEGKNVNMLMPDPFQNEHDGYIKRYLLTGVKKIIGIGREVVGRRKDGSTFPMDLAISELFVGERKMFTGIVRDISERKRIEEELRQQSTSVEQRNRELNDATMRANEATAAKSAFLAHMSHEIRTPMTAILGFAEQLQVGQLNQDEQRAAIDTIRRNGQFLLQIINDILDVSKIEAGKLGVELASCSPCEILAEVASLMQVQADKKNIYFKIEPNGPLPEMIRSDPLRLRQILINLLGNAIKFTEKGGVRLVSHFTMGPPATIEFDIIDTGIGLATDKWSTLFQPFAQADSSTTRRYGGTGLGLIISRKLAELLGGGIDIVSSAPGEGTVMRVTIHADQLDCERMVRDPERIIRDLAAESNVEKKCTKDETKPLENLRILLAEDGPDNQRLITSILTKAGANVVLAENGRAAVEKVWRAIESPSPFHIILMDMQMPILDGYDSTIELRSKGYRGPIIAVTAHAMDGEKEKCLAAGCDDYVSKPMNRATLINSVLAHCNTKLAKYQPSIQT